MPSTVVIRAKLELAVTEVSAAETLLEEAIGGLRPRPRAEKIRVSDVLENAFLRLRAARAELATLRERLHDA